MARTVLSGTLSRSCSSMTTYWPLDHSKPRTVSEREISPCSGQCVFICTRLRQVLCSRLKDRPPRDSVARYSFTGMVTSPNWIAPRHIARAMHALLACVVTTGTTCQGHRRCPDAEQGTRHMQVGPLRLCSAAFREGPLRACVG